ncbi:transcriptional regulator, TetR family [Solimonas aquatica]|uniref:Transcriptional regulator, TetR family n=1 Tax=Solimonas aquatica TaxID=489703 RepID=A0A1H8ZN10_9GAMM|nr:helix-turn-helix domain-containing protein [Solimonas aquatica]SEP65906.1 transcriptional regulator, TetR family [Solimonas aquatica]
MMPHRNHSYRERLPTVSDARAVRTRASLRQALLTLLETRTMDQIGIRDIAAQAGIGYATFYRHHQTKEALLDDLAAEEILRLNERVVPLMEARRTKAASEALFRYVDQNRALWATFLTGGAAGKLREALLKAALAIAAARTRPSEWSLIELATRLLVGGTVEFLAWWVREAQAMPIRQAAELHAQVVVMPVLGKLTDPGRNKTLGVARPSRTGRRAS